jgi:hypothetical protein
MLLSQARLVFFFLESQENETRQKMAAERFVITPDAKLVITFLTILTQQDLSVA